MGHRSRANQRRRLSWHYGEREGVLKLSGGCVQEGEEGAGHRSRANQSEAPAELASGYGQREGS